VGRSNEKQSYPARPMTGTSSKMLNRQELIENIYTHSATQPNRTFSAKALTTLQPSTTTKDKPTQKAKISKKKEEMAEEIMNLKQTVNKLVEELSLQKGKTENMRKKNVKYTKTFEI
jgi:HAMP domain-containing protein